MSRDLGISFENFIRYCLKGKNNKTVALFLRATSSRLILHNLIPTERLIDVDKPAKDIKLGKTPNASAYIIRFIIVARQPMKIFMRNITRRPENRYIRSS